MEAGEELKDLPACAICGRGQEQNKKLYHHHITYQPEQMVQVCRQCHSVIHWINHIGMDKLNTILSWVLVHGDSWVNGNAQYSKSNHKKFINRVWQQKNRERINIQNRERWKKDPERHRNYMRAYRIRQKEGRKLNG